MCFGFGQGDAFFQTIGAIDDGSVYFCSGEVLD